MLIKVLLFTSILVTFLTMNSASADNPSQPGDLYATVYSDTAAELFWARSTDGGFIQGYEVSINGNVEAFLDGASYFTDSLKLGYSYDFQVTAIDDQGLRSDPASVSFIGGDRGRTGGSGPLPPANLRALVYSSTAIELFWDRVSGAALTYEIAIGGSVEATNDGTSFFVHELEPGHSYLFSVVAIDGSSNRSVASSVEAETNGNTGMQTMGPSAPASMSLIVYSQTVAELFWDRAPADDHIASTEIVRDGEVIGTAEGNSFFDNTRESGANYIYDLTAIDNRGRRSINVQLIEPPLIPIINRDNHIGVVADALAAYFGDSYNALLVESLDRILGGFLGEVFPDDINFPTTYTCTNGGTAYFENSPYEIYFSDCQIDDAAYDGQYSIQVGNSNLVSSDGFTITTLPDTTLQFDGTIIIAGKDYYATREVNAHLTTPTSTLSMAAVNTEFSFTHRLRCCSSSSNFLAEFSGSFDFFTHHTNDEQIYVSTLSDFNYSEPMATHSDNWNYRTGVLQLSASDDSELVLDADTGDDSTVNIQIKNRNGIEEFIQPWSLWQSVLRRSP